MVCDEVSLRVERPRALWTSLETGGPEAHPRPARGQVGLENHPERREHDALTSPAYLIGASKLMVGDSTKRRVTTVKDARSLWLLSSWYLWTLDWNKQLLRAPRLHTILRVYRLALEGNVLLQYAVCDVTMILNLFINNINESYFHLYVSQFLKVCILNNNLDLLYYTITKEKNVYCLQETNKIFNVRLKKFNLFNVIQFKVNELVVNLFQSVHRTKRPKGRRIYSNKLQGNCYHFNLLLQIKSVVSFKPNRLKTERALGKCIAAAKAVTVSNLRKSKVHYERLFVIWT